MRFHAPLIPATLVKLYQRFLADMALPDGTAFDRARSRRVEAMAWKCMVTMEEIKMVEPAAIEE